ncbi:ubiquinone biosynthesis protein UbiE [Sulfuricella sp. T08]|uniref:class I SAM-dependent methyltransferase n=1 Tax=Sulfuricella sp. T08 TaxID=1632857 RepID=UPI0006179E7C|nr:class I SAM-dependent methyltransferase [Sulfuricella sp. T08]GAO36470.1 ubiquinone biosynthesis protein UbiE [Sulfuricella sp. T08]
MDSLTRKYKIKDTFDAASEGYDKPALRFFINAADQLANNMAFSGDEHILDVACGTGTVTLACAHRLSHGHVTGVDLSEGMLEKARAKALAQHHGNISFLCSDLESMNFGAGKFDAAVCGFGIFFLPEMEAAFKIIASHIKPGGTIGISSFTGAVMEPLSQSFIDRIQTHGVELPPLSWKRLDDAAKHRALYEAAGMERVNTHTMQAGYHLTGFDDWWDILWYSGFRGLLNQLSEGALTSFKQEHRSEIEKFATEQGIWLNVEVIISVGHKPA